MFTSFTAKRLIKEGIVALFYLGCLAALPNLLISNNNDPLTAFDPGQPG